MSSNLQKILVSIAWLSKNGYPITKKGISNYCGLSRPTVHKYFKQLDSLFLIDNSERYKSNYRRLKK